MAYESGFRSGGLASGLDSNTLIDQLTQLESRPLTQLRARQSAIKGQVSVLADIASKLSGLEAAARKLGDKGTLALKATSQNTTFSVVPSSAADAGRYSVAVEGLAAAAKARSTGFASAAAPVMGGTLHIEVDGQGWDVEVGDGSALSDVALAINRSGAPVSASLLSDGTSTYLSVTNRSTGFRPGEAPASALVLTESSSGINGSALGLATVAPAANAKVRVDGLLFERRSNEVTDVLPGTTLTLKALGAAEDVVVAEDVSGTGDNLEAFVTAYNDVAKLVQRQLAVSENTSREKTLAGDPAIRALQRGLQRLTSAPVEGLGTVRTLADLGLKTGRDGALSLDRKVLGEAIARAPGAVNALFSQASDGVGAATRTLVQTQTRTGDGILTSRSDGLNRTVKDLDKQAERLQMRIDAFRQNLIRQYAAMEKVVSGLKATGNFLSQQDSLLAKANS